AMTLVKVSKTDIADGEEIEGAHIQIIDKDGKVVEEWTSTKEVHEIKGLKVNEQYTLRENISPTGYGIATDTTFTIDEAGKVTTTGTITENGIILVEDERIICNLKIVDEESKKYIEGVVIKLSDEDGNIVDTWQSTNNELYPLGSKLRPGHTYTVTADSSPEGYVYFKDITVEVDKDGKVTVKPEGTGFDKSTNTFIVEEGKIHFPVNRTDSSDDKELDGGKIEIIKIEDDGTKKVIDSWKPEKGKTHDFGDKLRPGGRYILHEENSPKGYHKYPDIEFSVGKDGKIIINMKPEKDKNGKEVYVLKTSAISNPTNPVNPNKPNNSSTSKKDKKATNTGDPTDLWYWLMLIGSLITAGGIIRIKHSYH
ncbi:MAG: hypothetical protein IKR11_09050, partial [Solobacterium sp.]|nr:hypothetical protein [Solobacterium sp.]